MNKLVPTVILALIASIVAAWYFANKTQNTITKSEPSNLLIVGTNAEYPPFSLMHNDAITGFDIDLIKEIAQRTGKKIELHDMPFDALVPALQAGTIQVIAAGISPTPERAQRVLFTKPYLNGDQLVIVSPAHTPIENLDKLIDEKALNVAVNEGFTADYYLSDYFKAEPRAPNIIRFATALESFMALNSSRAQAFIAAQNTVKPFIEQYGPDKFNVVPIANTSDEYALAISKKYPELLPIIQNALDEIIQDGTLEQLKKKWKLD